MFYGLFENEASVFEEFDVRPEDRVGIKILFAWYEYEDYSGNAFVLLERDGKLYEVHGSHCSCYGLGPYRGSDYQWDLEECTYESLVKTTACSYTLEGVRAEWDAFLPTLKPE